MNPTPRLSPQDALPTLWVDVTTLSRWQRPAVGIVRVEQQLCAWLLAAGHPDVGFCTYDKAQSRFYRVGPEAVCAHLARIDSLSLSAPPAGTQAPPGPGAPRIRHRLKAAIQRLPPVLGVPLFNTLQRLRPYAGRLWRRTQPLRHHLLHTLPQYLQRRRPRRQPAAAAFNRATTLTPSLQFAPNSVYISVGLDWDYKDMAQIYRQKQAAGFKCLFFCYDIIPVLKPQLCVADVSRQFAHYFADLAWAADRILCISDASKRDLLRLLDTLDVPCRSVERVHLGGDILPQAGALSPSTQINALLAEPYILFVSTIERRKNHEVLYRAYSRLAAEGLDLPRLIFVGMPGWGVQELLSDLHLDPLVAGRIEQLHHVGDTDLALLYQQALFTVYPSLYEGWGLPVAESLAFGKYCLSSNAASLPEVGADWVDYLDPWDLPAWVERLRFLITHPEWVEVRNAKITREYRAHPWQATAAEIYHHARALQAQAVAA